MFNDTIAAIATARAESALAVIRISGSQAIEIVNSLFDRDLSQADGYTLHYGMIIADKEPVDEVLVSIFRRPKSFTGEDMAEISCHGGMYVTGRILSLLIGAGARLARPGEFSERAFLSGRIDLAQAEGINDLIRAKDEVNAVSALHSLKGSVARLIAPLTDEILQMIAHIEVNIDYPEYEDVRQLSDQEILPAAERWLQQIGEIIRQAQSAVLIRGGIDTVILGKPNVGKSSLLNALLEEDKAIVTEIAGTTRDLVEGSVKIGDITLNLIDTAGIHQPGDAIEQMGIERSLKALEKAELVIVVLDSSSAIDEDDQKLLDLTAGRNRIVVYNKKDKKELPGTIAVSAINGDISNLKAAIQEKYAGAMQAARQDTLNNERQIGLAIRAQRCMADAVQALRSQVEVDLVTIDLQDAYEALKEITGEGSREDLLDAIFSRFCLGK